MTATATTDVSPSEKQETMTDKGTPQTPAASTFSTPLQDASQCISDIISALDNGTPGKILDISAKLKDAIYAVNDSDVARRVSELCADVVARHVPEFLREHIGEELARACTIPTARIPLIARAAAIASLPVTEQEQEIKDLITSIVGCGLDTEEDVDKNGNPTALKKIKDTFKQDCPLGIDDKKLVDLLAHKRQCEANAGNERYERMCHGDCEGDITLEELIASLRQISYWANRGEHSIAPSSSIDSVFTAEARVEINPILEMRARKVSSFPEETLATATLGWILRYGGKLYRAESGIAYLAFENRVMEISDNPKFTAWLSRQSGLTSVTLPSKVVVAALRSHAENFGARIKSPASSYAVNESVYLHPQLDNDDRIIQIGPNSIKLVDNGTDDVVLTPCDEIDSFHLVEDPEKLVSAPMKLRRFFLNRLPCSPAERLLVLCYSAATSLRDHAKVHPALHATGSTNEGKSSIAMFMTGLLYGREDLEIPTPAACYTLAARLPLLVLDNKEAQNMSEADKTFLLAVATRAGRTKRTIGTNTGVIHEDPNCMVVLTAIDPQSLPEIRNRFFRVTASKEYWERRDENGKPKAHPQGKILRELSEVRDEVFSWLLHILATRILPGFRDKWWKMVDQIQQLVPAGGCVRGDEYMGLMALWLYALAPELGYNADEILRAWVVGQSDASEADQAQDSICVLAMDAILNDLRVRNGSKAAHRGIVPIEEEHCEGDRTPEIIGFEASLRKFVLAAQDLVKDFPYKKPLQLRNRFANESAAAEREGWKIETVQADNGKPKHTEDGNLYRFKNLDETEPPDDSPSEEKEVEGNRGDFSIPPDEPPPMTS